MKYILIFQKLKWSREEVKEFLIKNGIDSKPRIGWNHILVALSVAKLKDFVDGRNLILLQYDEESSFISENALIFNGEGKFSEIDVNQLFENIDGLSFDIKYFAMSPKNRSDIETLSRDLFASCEENGIKRCMLAISENCQKIISNKNIPLEIKKLLLDIITTRASTLLILKKLSGESGEKENLLAHYSMTLTLTHF